MALLRGATPTPNGPFQIPQTDANGVFDFDAATGLYLPKGAGKAPGAEGDLVFDTTQRQYLGRDAILGTAKKAMTAVLALYRPAEQLSAATGTSEQNFTQTYTLPANYFIAQKAVRVSAYFEIVSSATSPTARMRLKLGSTVMYDGTAASPGNNLATRGFMLQVVLQGTAAPGAAVAVDAGTSTAIASSWPPANSTAQPVNIATNASQAITLSIQYSATTAGNTITLRQLLIEEIN
jgi:hypothetical protein